jgi:D-3-phosphoglycerate dehydrogenase / 2-oxoglutarate reductase
VHVNRTFLVRQVVLLTHPIHADAMRLIRAVAELKILSKPTEAELLREITTAAALVVRMPISAEAVRAGKRLRVVARHGVGLDYIPVDVCTELGIPVTFTPDANTESVAEHVIGCMIALAHGFAPADRAVRQGNWAWRDKNIGCDLFSRALGIIGLGRIGLRVAEIATLAFRMNVRGYDPYLSSDVFASRDVICAPLDELLSKSDFVTIHVPLTPETKHLLNSVRIGSIKRGSFLINAARGDLIETEALAKALSSHHLAGAALDVLEDEPPKPDNALVGLENVLITPHSAALTAEAMYRMGMTAAEDIVRVLRGEAPINIANRPMRACSRIG